MHDQQAKASLQKQTSTSVIDILSLQKKSTPI